MRIGLQIGFWVAGLLLQVLVVQGLLRGGYKRYPLLFVYAIAVFLTTVAEASGFTAASQGARQFAKTIGLYYWIADAVLQALVFGVVISLIRQALEYSGSRPEWRKWLTLGAGLIFVLSFVAHAGPKAEINRWMTLISRDLSFAAAILDLILWTLLIAAKRRDHQLLLLSGALGIQFAGAAMGQSLRYLAVQMLNRNRGVALAGGILVALSNLACFFVWWQALRQPSRSEAAAAARRI
jgi:hypothetical protein